MSRRFNINLGGGSQGQQNSPQRGYEQPPSGFQGSPYQPQDGYGAPPPSFRGFPNQPQQSYGAPPFGFQGSPYQPQEGYGSSPRSSRDLPPRSAFSFSGGPGLSFPTSGGPRMTRANGEQINFTMDELRDAMDELGYGAPPCGFEDPYQPQQGYGSPPCGSRGSPYEPQQRRGRSPPRGAPASSDPMDRPYRRVDLDNGESYVYTRRQWESLMQSMDSILDEPQQPQQPQQPQRFPNTPGSRQLYQLGETMHDDSDLLRPSGQRGNCFLCRDRMAPGNHDARRLPCGHVFGLECIFNWIGEQANNDRNAEVTGIAKVSCPVCRKQFEVEDP